jgi:hypothetical protein
MPVRLAKNQRRKAALQREMQGTRRMCGGAKKHLDDAGGRACRAARKNKIAAGTRGSAVIHDAGGRGWAGGRGAWADGRAASVVRVQGGVMRACACRGRSVAETGKEKGGCVAAAALSGR